MGVALGFGMVAGAAANQWGHVVGSAPMLAAVLCAAPFLRKRDLILMSLVAMLTRDAIGGVSWFTLVRLAAILSVVGVLRILRVRPLVKSFVIGLGASSAVYHVVLTMGDWVTQTCSKAPLTWRGLQEVFVSNVSYAGRSILTDAVFAGAFLTLYLMMGLFMASRWPSVFSLPSPSTNR